MDFVKTYVTREFTAHFGDRMLTELFLAVELIDELTKSEPFGKISVRIKEGDIEALRNPSGYYLFIIRRTDKELSEFKEEEKYSVCIESDYYFYIEQEVKIPDLKILPLEFEGSGPKKDSLCVKLKKVADLHVDDLIELSNPDGKKEKRSVSEINVGDRTIQWRLGLENDYSMADSTVVALKYPLKVFHLKPASSYPFSEMVTLVRGRVADIDPKAPPIVSVEGRIETITDERGEFVLYLKGVKGKTIAIVIKKDQLQKEIPVSVKKEGERISLGVISVP